MAYNPKTASRSHVGHGLKIAEAFDAAQVLTTARIVPLVGLGIFMMEVLMLFAKGPRMMMQVISAFVGRQRLRAELSALDDRLLADIGIDRGLIDGVVAGRIRRDARLPVTAGANVGVAANENAARPVAA